MITKAYKVYGIPGHRQRVSFEPSAVYNCWTNSEIGTRIVELECSDKTGTNDYVIVRITSDSADECDREFYAQLSDGIFENSRVGEWMEIES